MSKLYIMIGPPGSGKSTIADELAQKKNLVKVSLDQIRSELNVHNPDQDKHIKTKEVAASRIAILLTYGLDVVYDSTNISAAERIYIIKQIKSKIKEPLEIIAMLVLCDIEECINRDQTREKAIGSQKVIQFLQSFSPPQLKEGFTSVSVFLNSQPTQLTQLLDKTKQGTTTKIKDKVLSLAAKYCEISQAKFALNMDKQLRGRFGHAGISSYMFMCSDLAKLSFSGGKYNMIADIATIISFYWLPILFNTREEFLRECNNLGIPERLIGGIEELYLYKAQIWQDYK